MKRLITAISVTVVGVLIGLLLLPFFVLGLPFWYYQRKRSEKAYAGFLKLYEGANFFCYNNRKNSQEFTERALIPELDPRIAIVFLEGRTVKSADYPEAFLSMALYRLKHYSRFPHLMKIREGKMIDMSINSLFFAVKNQGQAIEKLLKKVHDFFELELPEMGQ